MKVDISIIIPIYKGKQYISYWLDTIRKNAIQLNALHLECELILVNDFPEEKIVVEDFQAVGFKIKALNSEKNQGIHGARIVGLEHAQGKWIVFIDQDDRITDDYLMKQNMRIGDADAVICNGFSKHYCKDVSNFIYADTNEQKRTTDLSYYISTGNPIYSPGQVMLRKAAIPYFWCQNKLNSNGADDYLLWILMLKQGKKFVLNEEKIYTHVEHGKNASKDMLCMAKSIHEAEHMLMENNLLDNMEKETIRNREIIDISAVRYVDIINTYDYWLYLESRHQSIADFLHAYGYFKVGVYGMGTLGNRLCDLLDNSDIEVVFAMDQHANKIICKVPVLCLEDDQIENYMEQVDVIIVTALSAFEIIREEISRKENQVLVLSLKDILLEMIESIVE